MKKMKKYLMLACALALPFLAACGGDEIEEVEEPTLISPPSNGLAERDVLVYIVAENSLNSYSATDIAEMLEGIEGVNVSKNSLFVYLDDVNAPQLIHITKYTDGTVAKQVLKEYDEQDSTDPEVMRTVFHDVFDTYPARSYGLVLWSHGEGWVPYLSSNYSVANTVQYLNWFGLDNNKNYASNGNDSSHMELADLAEVLTSTVHFDFLLFDACFMQSVEVLYELKDCADYFIGSPAEIPGPGSPYQKVVPCFFSSASSYPTNIATTYFDYYESIYDPSSYSSSEWSQGVCISVVKSSGLTSLARATAKIVPQYLADNYSPSIANVLCYDGGRSAKLYYHDMKEYVALLTATDEAAYAEWLTAFGQAVPYWAFTPTTYTAYSSQNIRITDTSGGLSMFVPRLTRSDVLPYFRQTQWYKEAGWTQTGW